MSITINSQLNVVEIQKVELNLIPKIMLPKILLAFELLFFLMSIGSKSASQKLSSFVAAIKLILEYCYLNLRDLLEVQTVS